MQRIVKNIVRNFFTYFLISKKIANEKRIKNIAKIIKDNLKKLNNKINIAPIKKNGINDKILLITVFFAVKTFSP